MKTPREILLERHRAAAPKLDAIRQSVVSEEFNNKATKEQSQNPNFVSLLLGCSDAIWRELILPSRRIWAGLAAVWLLLFAVNLSMRDHSAAIAMKSPPSPEMILSFRQQEKLLTELIGPNDSPAAEPSKIFLPRPSGERRFEIFAV